MGLNGCIKGAGGDAFVFRHQVIGKLVEIRNATDQCCTCHQLLTPIQEVQDQFRIFRVTFNKLVIRVGIIGLLYPAVFAEVVQANHAVAAAQQLLNQISSNEAVGAGDKNCFLVFLIRLRRHGKPVWCRNLV